MKGAVMEICEIEKAVRSIGMYSENAIQRTINQFKSLDYEAIDSEAFERWFKPKKFLAEGIRNPGLYFIKCVKDEIALGTFKTLSKPQPSAAATTIKDLSVEDFEKEWDEWCEVIRGLSLDPENPDVPGKGTVIGELHCVDGVRGISTGDGRFVYLDGTVSQRFKRFEDLTIQEKEDLINAFDERNTRGTGRLIIADALLEKMRSLAGGSAV